MRNLKKVLALVLALVMSLSLVTIANASDFTDVDEINYKEAVDVMTAIGVIEGLDTGAFNPDGTLTREQAAAIICRMLLGDGAANLGTNTSSFTDVAATRWSAPYIEYCTSIGIIAGNGNGTFNPTGKLTGHAFAKMLLGALGYDAEVEQFVNTSAWAVNVAKYAVSSGIAVDDVVMSAELTREQAAQMAFNTLTAVLVDYKGGTNITAPDGTSVVVDAERYDVTNLSTSGYKMADNDGYMQFCEQYFSKLKLNEDGEDDLNRPSNTWIYANKSIGEYAKTPTVVYTAYMNNDSGKKTVSSDLKGYYYGGTAAGSKVVSAGNVASTDIDASDEVAALTGNGRSVEIYVTDNIITDIVAIDSQLVEIKKITDDEVTFVGSGVNAVEEDDDLYNFFANMEKEDKVVVIVDDNDDVIEAYVPDMVTGKFTKTKGSAPTTEYTVGGEVYQKANTGSASDLSAGNLNNTYTLTLDKYGYILAVGDEEVADDVYAYVMDYSANVNRGDYDYALTTLFTDGTIAWGDVAEVNDDVVADDEVDTDEMAALKGEFVAYTEGDDGYAVTTKTATDVNGDITKGDSTIFGNKTASNKTIFLVKDGSSYTVYTGIKNVPSMNVASGKGYALLDGSVALIVVVDESSTTSNEDQVFIYDTTVVGTEKDGDNVVKYYNAIVNGEDTTIGVKDGESVEVALYVNNSYTKEYISDLGDKYDAGAADTSSIKVYTQATEGLSDLKLKNGVLTIDMTSDDTYVMADEYESWIVKAAAKEVDALSLDSDSTMTSEDITLAAGDYVVVVLDDDGYVTNLYLVDVA